MASTPDILSKLNVGSGMNTSDIISSLVDAERAPALDRIEKNETATKNKISSYGILKSDIQDFRDIVRTIEIVMLLVILVLQVILLLLIFQQQGLLVVKILMLLW